MSRGRVYVWHPDAAHPLDGRLTLEVRSLPRLDAPAESCEQRLEGRYVSVRNGGAINEPDTVTGVPRPIALGDARPNAEGDFLFHPGRGGGRVDKSLGTPEFRDRYVQAARFGEVNTYYHLDRIAAYIDELLYELGAASLPRVVAVVNAHHGATERADGVRDGRLVSGRWHPFQGGHYRMPSRRYDAAEYEPLSPDGEIHLGPGRKLLHHGALVELGAGTYRANAAHNPGILYHEYGHHLTQHTADFRANALRRSERKNNRKTAMDEGTCDYWAAVMLETPHIWACHRHHDHQVHHPRSLASRKTMAAFDRGTKADPHANGTIWGAALWDLRNCLRRTTRDGGRRADLLVLLALCLTGQLGMGDASRTVASVRRARLSFTTGLEALLDADRRLYAGRHRDAIIACFSHRGIARVGGGAPATVPALARSTFDEAG